MEVYESELREKIKLHLVDSTAIAIEANPPYAALETLVSGMSSAVSFNARLIGTGLLYFGLGYCYGKGRDLWRNKFRINDKSSETSQFTNDFMYGATFNLFVAPLLYTISGAKDIKEVAIGTACSMIFGGFNGIPVGYAIDCFRDLTGVKESKRAPQFLKNKSKIAKQSVAIGLLLASVGLMSGVYHVNERLNVNLETVVDQK